MKIDVSKGLSMLDFLKGYKPPGYNDSGLSHHRPSAAKYLNSGFTCQQIRYLKSLIANMARFLLLLSETNIMIEVFKVASAQWLLFYQWI